MNPNLAPFLNESLRIAGVTRPALPTEVTATAEFIQLKRMTVEEVVKLARVYVPDAQLRDRKGMDPKRRRSDTPRGGPAVPKWLLAILVAANEITVEPCAAHVDFMTLSPLSAGNGRVGRAVWAWQMERRSGVPPSFLTEFYRQSLESYR